MKLFRINLFFLISALLINSVFAQSSAPFEQIQASNYKLGPGDKIKIIVFNQEDMSGEYSINGSGHISFPLIGDVAAKDITVSELENAICDKLKPDYLLNPKITIQVLDYRPFYILGEVKEPKSYPYVDGMSFRNAVAIAGGFTYRAKEDHVLVFRNQSKQELKFDIDETAQPGDVIMVEERFF